MIVNVEDVANNVVKQFESKLIGGEKGSSSSLLAVVLHHTILWLKFKNIEVVIKELMKIKLMSMFSTSSLWKVNRIIFTL